jgi:hypothetical protein
MDGETDMTKLFEILRTRLKCDPEGIYEFKRPVKNTSSNKPYLVLNRLYHT